MLDEPAAQPQAAETGAGTTQPKYFVDVNADGQLSPHDLLMVINYLLTAPAATPSAAPSAEPLAAPAVDEAMVLFDDTETTLVEPAVKLETILPKDDSPVGATAAGTTLFVLDEETPELKSSDDTPDSADDGSVAALLDS